MIKNKTTMSSNDLNYKSLKVRWRIVVAFKDKRDIFFFDPLRSTTPKIENEGETRYEILQPLKGTTWNLPNNRNRAHKRLYAV